MSDSILSFLILKFTNWHGFYFKKLSAEYENSQRTLRIHGISILSDDGRGEAS